MRKYLKDGKKMKKALSILLILALILIPLAACADETTVDTPANDDTPVPDGDLEDVTLRLWGGELCQDLLRERADAFIAYWAHEANITIEVGIVSEADLRDTVLTDPEAAADVWAMADDQVASLYRAGALQEVLLNADEISAANAPGAVEAASIDGKLVAYPMTASNGYFMFYDSSIFTEEDVQSWDRMLEVAEAAGSQITMHVANGWYNISFFRSVGLDAWLADDGVSTETNIDDPQGVEVVQAMLDLVSHPAFLATEDGNFMTLMTDGTTVAGVNGPWNADPLEEVLGENFAATILPTLNVGGQQVRMGGVVGFTFLGVNPHSEYVGWAMRLAEFLTSYESQVIRLEVRGQGPTNIQAAASPAAQASPALAAIAAQAAYSAIINVGGDYWTPMETLGAIIAQGNPDNIPLQELLSTAAAGIRGVAPAETDTDDAGEDSDEEFEDYEYDEEYDDEEDED